jgi:uncharacterized protein (DUF1697 family)
MKYVAFFRNVNLGQGINPTRPQLEAAFASAGASEVRSFQTAGTVVFSAAGEPEAELMVARARETLLELRGLREPAYVAPLDHLIGLVAQEPFVSYDLTGEFDASATVLPRHALARLSLPLVSPRGGFEVIRLTPYLALTVGPRESVSRENPTPFFEKLLNVPATTRSWGTILRLVTKYTLKGEQDALQE